ncbi:MAG: hypothetical protein KGQ26_00890 [Rhodospirillales bacterium]|nr:hypothetical protein [Rhodospirillales bacterium]
MGVPAVGLPGLELAPLPIPLGGAAIIGVEPGVPVPIVPVLADPMDPVAFVPPFAVLLVEFMPFALPLVMPVELVPLVPTLADVLPADWAKAGA